MSLVGERPSREELGELSAGGLERALVEWEKRRRVAESVILDVMDHADRRGLYADDGHRSVGEWMRTLTNVSRAEAKQRVRSMKALRDLERVRERLRDAELGVDQVRAFAAVHANPRCRRQLPESEELLVEHAAHLRFADFAVVLHRWEALADADGAHRSQERAHEQRDAFIVQLGSGFHVEARCGAVQGAALQEIFDRFVDAEFHADWDAARARWGDATSIDLLERSGPQRRFDALFAIFMAAASSNVRGQAPEPLVNIVVDQATFEAHLAHAAGGPKPSFDPTEVDRRRCETVGGVPIDPADAVVAAVIGQVRRVVMDAAGVVIDLGRKRRLFTGSAREAVVLSGRGCFWGCDAPPTQIDHLRPWAHAGPTSPDNGGGGCGHHNRFKTRGYHAFRDPAGRWHILRPDGTPITEPRAA